MIVLGLLATAVLAGCGDDGDVEEGLGTTSTTEPPEPFRVLLSSASGDGQGIVALENALDPLPGMELTISIPAFAGHDVGTLSADAPPDVTGGDVSGTDATVVDAFPVDAVTVAVDAAPEGAESFDLAVIGVDEGHNLVDAGQERTATGTIGAGRAAAEAGIPTLAVGQGITGAGPADWDAGADTVVEWIEAHRDEILADPSDGPGSLFALNVPTCVEGESLGLLELDAPGPPLTEADEDAVASGDCTGAQDPDGAVAAFIAGWSPVFPVALVEPGDAG